MQKLDLTELYTTRLLIFLEDEPQSNTYRQVILTPEQFKTTSLSLGEVLHTEGDQQDVALQLSEETYQLPDLPEKYGSQE